MSEGNYRDELAAAHARIEELERRLGEAHGTGGVAEPWLVELEARRAAVLAEAAKGMGDSKRRWRVRGIIVATALVLGTIISLLAGTLAPFVPLGFLTLHPGMLLVWVLGSKKRQVAKTELAKIDEKVADVRRMAEMMGASRVRVGVVEEGRAGRRQAPETVELDADPAAARGTHRG